MSAGAFITAFYTTNAGNKVAVRLQPETTQVILGGGTNVPGTGPADSGWPSAVVSKSRRGIGIHPRLATVKFTGTPPTGYKAGSTYRIVVLNEAVWTPLGKGSIGQYLGQDIEVVSTTPEKIV